MHPFPSCLYRKQHGRFLLPVPAINDVEKYKSAKLYVTRDRAVRLKKDEYFVADLIGMQVVTEEGEAFGLLKDVP